MNYPHCNSPGCSQKYPPKSSTKHCNSPGCTGGHQSENLPYTQDSRPTVTKHWIGPEKRPTVSTGEAFSSVRLELSGSDYTVVFASYPGVQKFGGYKLLVYSTAAWAQVNERQIDPHFYADESSPVARFMPTLAGAKLAIKCAFGDKPSEYELQTLVGVMKRLAIVGGGV